MKLWEIGEEKCSFKVYIVRIKKCFHSLYNHMQTWFRYHNSHVLDLSLNCRGLIQDTLTLLGEGRYCLMLALSLSLNVTHIEIFISYWCHRFIKKNVSLTSVRYSSL